MYLVFVYCVGILRKYICSQRDEKRTASMKMEICVVILGGLPSQSSRIYQNTSFILTLTIVSKAASFHILTARQHSINSVCGSTMNQSPHLGHLSLYNRERLNFYSQKHFLSSLSCPFNHFFSPYPLFFSCVSPLHPIPPFCSSADRFALSSPSFSSPLPLHPIGGNLLA